ncbi:hypothetical protein [Micromonospora sp. DT62]|uniref:hypothetical protein n=1 Tax=Micromonospora sp. DT62 TaxID=3416521 RepID=UPI003CEA2DC5
MRRGAPSARPLQRGGRLGEPAGAGVPGEALVDGAWTTIGSAGANTASPARVDLAGAPTGIRQVRLVFTEPSPTDGLARVFEVEIHGLR